MNDEELAQVIALRHDLHAHPELSGKEVRTRRVLMDFVKQNSDFEVVPCQGWFYACRHSEHPQAAPIAFRADMDALPIAETMDLPYASTVPGVSHKCGHDGHSAALAGLSMALTGKPLCRDVYLIFQPAEEIGTGGEMCASLLKEKGIREIYAFHNLGGYPEGAVVYRHGLTQPASMGLTLSFAGKKSHAADPEQGINPSETIARLVLFLKEACRDQSRGLLLATVVQMEAGSRNFGISAGSGSLSVTLRAEAEAEMNRLKEALCSQAQRLASAQHLKLSVSISDLFPETRNDETCLNRVISAAKQNGYSTIPMPELWRASEDFGSYLHQCPGAMFYLGNGETWPVLHSEAYDFNDHLLGRAVQMFASLI